MSRLIFALGAAAACLLAAKLVLRKSAPKAISFHPVLRQIRELSNGCLHYQPRP